jgi:hypothetical protein
MGNRNTWKQNNLTSCSTRRRKALWRFAVNLSAARVSKNVRGLMRLALAFLSAIIVPAILISGWYLYGQFETFESDDPYIWVRTRGFLGLTLFISGAFVLLLGLPAYFILRYFKFINWWATLISGFILGAAPMAIFTWPLSYPELNTNASVNGVQTIINGTPTMAGWLQFVEGVSFFGGCGLAAALVFWLVAPNKNI